MYRCCKLREKSVSFSLYTPAWNPHENFAALYFSYRATSRAASRSLEAREAACACDDHQAGMLTLTKVTRRGGKSAEYIWQLDDRSREFAWLTEALMLWGWTRQSELENFLGQCFNTATGAPDKPFRAVFV